ncbi:MAG: hypothetical protein Q7R57_06645, partial [Dehalococcoidales bacterium]|nr:hypothetical protein [Dehalococcoidales bacterium]
MEQTLRPGDVLLFRPAGWGVLLPVVRWLVTYDHAALYWTETKRGLPLIIESIGRGVLIRSLFAYAGRPVRLMRPKIDDDLALKIAKEAERLADNPGSWYGYFDIPRYVLPKLILAKIGQLLPSRWALTLRLLALSYRRNNLYICSELVAEAYRRAGVPLVEENTIPLPDDIAGSEKLDSLGDVTVPPPDALAPGIRLINQLVRYRNGRQNRSE